MLELFERDRSIGIMSVISLLIYFEKNKDKKHGKYVKYTNALLGTTDIVFVTT
jgi:hypothetical protein